MNLRKKEKDLTQNASNLINLGQSGQNFVVDYLIKKGFIIKAQNYHQKFGEIDLIAQQNDLIIFVEVKTRKKNYFNLSEVIVLSKQKKIILTAKSYISKNNFIDKIYRFDVALVHQENGEFKINYIENAFTE